ncbi:MAG: heavy-metal-associated domain-containing protein [Clostridiales bacterium]|nr:heavy-metal-associated domain-containing protein [Clostridiales bacterium]
MKKVIAMQDLDCANCAAKMEQAIRKIDGVQSCTINFMLQRMTLEFDENNSEEIIKQIKATIKKIEPDCRLKI